MVHKINVGQVKNVLLFDFNNNPNLKLNSFIKNELVHNLNVESTLDSKVVLKKVKQSNIDLLLVGIDKTDNVIDLLTQVRNLAKDIPVMHRTPKRGHHEAPRRALSTAGRFTPGRRF